MRHGSVNRGPNLATTTNSLRPCKSLWRMHLASTRASSNVVFHYSECGKMFLRRRRMASWKRCKDCYPDIERRSKDNPGSLPMLERLHDASTSTWFPAT